MGTLAGAVEAVAKLASQVWGYFRGTQTRQGAKREDASAKALQRAEAAESAPDLNAAFTDLERLYEDASAKRHQR